MNNREKLRLKQVETNILNNLIENLIRVRDINYDELTEEELKYEGLRSHYKSKPIYIKNVIKSIEDEISFYIDSLEANGVISGREQRLIDVRIEPDLKLTLEDLNNQIEQAVENENYELAEKLKNKIKK